MSTIFAELVQQAQQAVEVCLDGTGYNPFSVIRGEAQNIVDELTSEEVVGLLAERPTIMENRISLGDREPRPVLFLDIAREAVQMEIEKNVDMTPISDAVRDWLNSAMVPQHLANEARRVTHSQSPRP